MLKIYGSYTPMYYKTVVVAQELGLDVSYVNVDILKRANREPEHLARHPFGKVPVLEHDGRYLFESNVICRYLADIAVSQLYPQERYARAVIDQWIDFFAQQPGRWTSSIWYQRCIIGPVFGGQPDQKVVDENLSQILEVMPVLDQHFAANQWLAGGAMSLADLVAVMLMQGWKHADVPLGDFSNFVRWFEVMSSRPTVADAIRDCNN